jgi:hypothetical protein
MEIKINKNIYKEKGLKNTIKCYKHLVKIDLREEGDYFVVKMIDMGRGVEKVIKDEFCNYLLFETSKCL